MENKKLLIKSPCINVFLYSIHALNKNGIPFKIKSDVHDDEPRLGELFYVDATKSTIGTQITFEFEDNSKMNNREFIHRRVYIARKFDSAHVMFVFEGDNISDPL